MFLMTLEQHLAQVARLRHALHVSAKADIGHPLTTTFVNTRPNWQRLHLTQSWPLAARPWVRCYRRLGQCRLCSWVSPIRSAPATLRAWRGPAAMLLDSPRLNTA